MKRLLTLFIVCLESLSLSFSQPPPRVKPSPWSAGIFLLSDSQPYAGASRAVRVYPSVNYRGERLQWNGPLLQYDFLIQENWRLGIHSVLQFSPYDEADAPILKGMGDRSDTVLAGIDWRYDPFPGWSVLSSLDVEIFRAYDGFQATFGIRRMLGKPWQRVSCSLGAGVLVQDQNWTRYFVGVPMAKATNDRPAYAPSESFHPYIAGQLLVRVYKNWSWFTLVRTEFLDETWRDSPLIADDYRLMAFTALNYSF